MNKFFKTKSYKKSVRKSFSVENPTPKYNLELRLEEFVTRFVTEFEAKLTSYSVILDGVLPKPESYSNSYVEKVGQCVGLILGGAAGFAVGLPEFGANAGMAISSEITKKIENVVGKNHHQCKLTKLSEFIYYFEQNKSEFRKMLVKVGLDIFQSFEMQFGRVISDLGERGAMNLLAIDAMNRAIEYISRTLAECDLDAHSLILEGLKLGRSKMEPVMNLQGLRLCKGFEIRFKDEKKEKMLKTGSLYSKVGIVIADIRNTEYYELKDGKNKTSKYGFRRCFTSEKWEEMNVSYVKANLYKRNDQLLDYSHFFNPNIVSEKSDNICAKLEVDRDQALGIDRINGLLNESKNEILEKLQALKPMCTKLEVESKILSNIESSLKNLKIEEYFSKFDSKMNRILDEISKGNDETHAKLDEINFSIGKILQNKFDNTHEKNSVWFEVRNELLTFTGREAILKQIESGLNDGPVVICGLGGIGKSELAVKYARTRYDELDNVIWINAETSESIAGSIWQLARVLNVNKQDDTGNDKDLNFVISEIYKLIFHQKCLLIIDNAKTFLDIELLLKWSNETKPNNNPKVLITSRNNSGWESGRFSIRIIQLEVFNRSEAIEFIQKSLSIDYDLFSSDINKLIHVLGNFPLALQLAVTNIKITNANYIKRNKTFSIENFLEKFEEQPQKLMGGKLPLDMYRPPYSIFIVVIYTFNQMKIENELGEKAQFILRMASYLAPDNINEDYFLDELEDEDELIDVMNLLENYSLVKINEGKLNVHRLVQQAIRLESENTEEFLLRKNLNLLMKKLTNWDNITFYSPHIFSIWDYACNYEKLIDEFVVNSTTKFYIYSSFLETLVQRNKIKLVKKIIDQIKNCSKSDELNEILVKIFGEKSIYFVSNHHDIVQLIKLTNSKPASNSPKLKHIANATVAFAISRKLNNNYSKKSNEPLAIRTEIFKLPETRL